jgi:hypothetical protein
VCKRGKDGDSGYVVEANITLKYVVEYFCTRIPSKSPKISRRSAGFCHDVSIYAQGVCHYIMLAADPCAHVRPQSRAHIVVHCLEYIYLYIYIYIYIYICVCVCVCVYIESE